MQICIHSLYQEHLEKQQISSGSKFVLNCLNYELQSEIQDGITVGYKLKCTKCKDDYYL